jgi:hypothetical protein
MFELLFCKRFILFLHTPEFDSKAWAGYIIRKVNQG